MKIIDTNCSFGNWPIQQFTHRSLHDLDEAMERNGIDEAWLTATESILFPDPDVYDFPLFERLQEFPRFRPVKTVNPLMVNWRESCLKAIEKHPIRALKLYPNYHGYPSNHEQLEHIATFAAEHKLPVLISIRVNDERDQPQNLRIAATNIPFLLSWIHRSPETQFIFHNAFNGELDYFKNVNNVFADLSFLDHASLIETVIKVLGFPLERLVFGSHACFLYPESSALKINLSQAGSEITARVAFQNAEKL